MVVFGKDELEKNVVKVKDMNNHEEVEVPFEEVCSVLISRGCRTVPSGADTSFLKLMQEKI